MKDVIEKLCELNEPIPVPLELPEEEPPVEIEEELLIGIPTEFREFLLLASDVVYSRLEPVIVTDSHSHTYLPKVVVTAWDLGVPRELIPLCGDDDSYHCVAENGEVVLWADGDLIDESWDSVWVWTRDVWLES